VTTKKQRELNGENTERKNSGAQENSDNQTKAQNRRKLRHSQQLNLQGPTKKLSLSQKQPLIEDEGKEGNLTEPVETLQDKDDHKNKSQYEPPNAASKIQNRNADSFVRKSGTHNIKGKGSRAHPKNVAQVAQQMIIRQGKTGKGRNSRSSAPPSDTESDIEADAQTRTTDNSNNISESTNNTSNNTNDSTTNNDSNTNNENNKKSTNDNATNKTATDYNDAAEALINTTLEYNEALDDEVTAQLDMELEKLCVSVKEEQTHTQQQQPQQQRGPEQAGANSTKNPSFIRDSGKYLTPISEGKVTDSSGGQ